MGAIVITGGRFTTRKITLQVNEVKNPLDRGFWWLFYAQTSIFSAASWR